MPLKGLGTEADIKLPSRSPAPPRARVYITEYNNLGDVQWETPMEPANRVHTVNIGDTSEEIGRETRFIALFATQPCRVSFVPTGEHIEDAESHAFPLAAGVETLRLMYMNTRFRLVTYGMDD